MVETGPQFKGAVVETGPQFKGVMVETGPCGHTVRIEVELPDTHTHTHFDIQPSILITIMTHTGHFNIATDVKQLYL